MGEFRKWCLRLPKVELHAHLNGSIRDSTLLELAEEHGKRGTVCFDEVRDIILKEDRSLQECFRLFDVIHILTTSHSVITRITKEVIEDFAAENVVYLELRTSPKNNAAIGMTKLSYLQAVVDGLRAALDGNTQTKIQVRLLLSIDRREDANAAMETVQLAVQMRECGIVGIDLSGNPATGKWNTFLPALTYAREQGFPVTLHCGEVHNPYEVEAMLLFRPERVGHVCILNDSQWTNLLKLRIPVEVCLTSNVRTKCVDSVADHHFACLYKKKHPMIICTDDRGVFATNLTQEYVIAATCFGLSKLQVFQLAKTACNFIFEGDEVKQSLLQHFTTLTESLLT